jgi:hypothetical protein
MEVENVRKLIFALQEVDPEKFNMGGLSFDRATTVKGMVDCYYHRDLNVCGTAGCISGWIGQIAFKNPHMDTRLTGEWLGLTSFEADCLFVPDGFRRERTLPTRDLVYPLSRALDTLRRMLSTYERTGITVIDWNPPPSRPLSRNANDALELRVEA